MMKVIGPFTLFGALAFLGLGAIFLIAGGSENIMVGAALVGIGLLLALAVYMMIRAEARRPTQVSQTVQLGGSGEFRERQVSCPGCGGVLAEKDLRLKDGGFVATCPYCGKVSMLEEEPKW